MTVPAAGKTTRLQKIPLVREKVTITRHPGTWAVQQPQPLPPPSYFNFGAGASEITGICAALGSWAEAAQRFDRRIKSLARDGCDGAQVAVPEAPGSPPSALKEVPDTIHVRNSPAVSVIATAQALNRHGLSSRPSYHPCIHQVDALVKDQAQSIQTRAVCPHNFLKDVSGGGTFGGYVRGNRSTTPLHSLEAPGTTTAHNARPPPFSAIPLPPI